MSKMELHKAIKEIIDQFGKEVIAEQRFLYMVADYYSFRDNPAVKRVLTALINGGYTALLLRDKTGSDFFITKDKLVNGVSDYYGFKEELVEDVVISIIEGLGEHVRKSNKVYLKEETFFNQSFQTNIVTPNNQAINIKQYTIFEKEFYLKSPPVANIGNFVAYDAKGYYNFENGFFVILKGSLLSVANTGSKYLLNSGELSRQGILNSHCHFKRPNYVVDKEIKCSSPNEAAFMVTGHSLIGLIVWEDKNGNSIYQDKRYKTIDVRRQDRLF